MLSYTCPATALAKSILDVWLSGDQRRLRLELDSVERMSLPVDSDDRCELLKSIAGKMQQSPDLYASRTESPRVGTWLDLLHHLSGESTLIH